MHVNITGHVKAKGDCGHELEIPVTGLEDDFTCPECGAVDRFSPEQAERIKAQLREAATKVGMDEIRKRFDQSMRRVASRHKNITYKPGRPRS